MIDLWIKTAGSVAHAHNHAATLVRGQEFNQVMVVAERDDFGGQWAQHHIRGLCFSDPLIAMRPDVLTRLTQNDLIILDALPMHTLADHVLFTALSQAEAQIWFVGRQLPLRYGVECLIEITENYARRELRHA